MQAIIMRATRFSEQRNLQRNKTTFLLPHLQKNGCGSLCCIKRSTICDTTRIQPVPQFMVDPAFAALLRAGHCGACADAAAGAAGHLYLRSGAPLDKNLCARLLASLQPDYEGFELRIQNLFGYAMLDEAALRDLMEEMKRDGVPINGFLDRCKINIIGQKITIGRMPWHQVFAGDAL